MSGSRRLLWWTPRVLGILVSGFVGIFALDAFNPGLPLVQALAEFAIHLTPAILVLAVVAGGWRRPRVGALGCLALGVAYAVIARGRLDWILVISGPLLVVAMLFLLADRR